MALWNSIQRCSVLSHRRYMHAIYLYLKLCVLCYIFYRVAQKTTFYSKCIYAFSSIAVTSVRCVLCVVCCVLCVVVVVVIACHFFLGAPRALKFETWDPWDIFSNYFFYFFKILKIDPSRSIFDLFLTYFLKSGAIFFWLVQILSFFVFRSSWGVARAPFLNFSKICIFASVTDPDGFRFFKNRPKLTFFWPTFLKVVPIFLVGPNP